MYVVVRISGKEFRPAAILRTRGRGDGVNDTFQGAKDARKNRGSWDAGVGFRLYKSILKTMILVKITKSYLGETYKSHLRLIEQRDQVRWVDTCQTKAAAPNTHQISHRQEVQEIQGHLVRGTKGKSFEFERRNWEHGADPWHLQELSVTRVRRKIGLEMEVFRVRTPNESIASRRVVVKSRHEREKQKRKFQFGLVAPLIRGNSKSAVR